MRDGMISVGLDAPAQPGNGLYVGAGAWGRLLEGVRIAHAFLRWTLVGELGGSGSG